MLNQINPAAYLRPGKLAVLLLVLAVSSQNIFALGGTNYVTTHFTTNSFALCDGQAATILIDTNDWPGVVRAADDLMTDLHRVTITGLKFLTNQSPPAKTSSSSAQLGKANSSTN